MLGIILMNTHANCEDTFNSCGMGYSTEAERA